MKKTCQLIGWLCLHIFREDFSHLGAAGIFLIAFSKLLYNWILISVTGLLKTDILHKSIDIVQ